MSPINAAYRLYSLNGKQSSVLFAIMYLPIGGLHQTARINNYHLQFQYDIHDNHWTKDA
ncbi:MAG: hypothetical protein AB8B48_06495 [Pseudomonadales bacterium]